MPNLKPTRLKTFAELRRGITPLIPGQPEMIPWVWYDSQTYTSGTTTQLDFFTSVQSDKVLGNMEAAGQIPAPMFFDLYHLTVYFDIVPSAVAVGATASNDGALDDVALLSRGSVELQIAQKIYFKDKIYACPAGGGIYGGVSNAGTYTATDGDQYQFAANGYPHANNKNNFFGMITIPHNQSFFVRMNWSSALTLNNGNTTIVSRLEGYLYRRVL